LNFEIKRKNRTIDQDGLQLQIDKTKLERRIVPSGVCVTSG